MIKKFFKENVVLLAVLTCIFLFHAVAGCYIAEKHPIFYNSNDGDEYYDMAVSFATDTSFTCHKHRYYELKHDKPLPEAHRAFGLPILAGLVMKIHNSIATTAVVIAMIFTLLCGVIFFLTLNLTGSRMGGWIALILCNIHPLMMQYSFQFSSETLFTLALLLFALTWQMKKDTILRYILLGIFGAMTALTRQTGMVLLPAACFFLALPSFLQNCKDRKIFRWNKEYNYALLYALIFFLCVTPYGLFNLKHHKTFSLSGYLGGYNIYFGNSLDNREAYRHLQEGQQFLYYQRKAWDKAIQTAQNLPDQYKNLPTEQDRLLKKKAIENIKKMGFKNFAELVLIRAWHFIQPWSVPGVHSPVIFWGMTCFSLLLYAAGITGIILLIKKGAWKKLLAFAAYIPGLWFAHAIVHFYLRHRIPIVDPVLIVGSAMTAVILLQKLKEHYSLMKLKKASQNS